ncbi:neuroblastoma-amplified sequence-like [Lytechinus variegatus]|uniref:neuroblastoma-amplified sequence-like n=1 Tax=Lytechinus variegatus TaxID=7654 RepID=UPI001BB19ACD|nr:neuroblastoma-amplified sequence-like [Lytechinus variegatus]
MASADEVTQNQGKEEEETILYDLFFPYEWSQESEPLTSVIAEKPRGSLIGKVSSATARSLWTFVRSTGIPLGSSSTCSLPATLIKLVNSQISWHIATASDGNLVAVLQDTCIEVRSSRDNFQSCVCKCQVPKDSHPQWRQVAWSPDWSLVACSDSRGNIRAFDLFGTLLFTIERSKPQPPDSPVDFSCAVASLQFTDYKQTAQWSAELLVINYHGSLDSYLVSSSGEYQYNHTFQFGSHYPQGISCATYDAKHSLLFIGGASQDDAPDTPTSASSLGLTAWRVLSIPPYYKLVQDYDSEYGKVGASRKLFRRMTTVNNIFMRSQKQDGIYRMCLSPKGSCLVTAHQSGLLCLWDVPSLRRKQAWALEDQPGFNETNPNILVPMRKKANDGASFSNLLIDINFWSEEAIILARCSGAVAVCSVANLSNLLGTSCEWLAPAPRVTLASEKGFMALDCESRSVPMKRPRSPTDGERDGDTSSMIEGTDDEEDDDDDDDDEDAPLLTKTAKYMKEVMYYVTESERFQPPRKKPRVTHRTYCLLSIQKTTPDELFLRKIQNEEYGEALALSQRFGLDSDLVYQTQWRKSRVSLASIQDYLSKITKRSWVLHECLDRIPDDIDAARELLLYGLRGTDLQALIAIGNQEDKGRFILCSDDDIELERPFDHYRHDDDDDEDEETEEELFERKKKEKRDKLLAQVDFSKLTLEQRELCRCRTRLLGYLDRLKTYEEILGGGESALRAYNEKDFEKFRSENIVEAAVRMARDSDWKALEIMFTYHGKDILPHWLMILNNFPETTPPTEYKTLLPEASYESEPEVYSWEQDQHRDQDWCEGPDCQRVINPTQLDYGAFLYEDSPELIKFRCEAMSKKLLTDWVIHRAMVVEDESRQVDNALSLVRLAMERNIPELESLHHDLLTLEVLSYECQTDPDLTLASLKKMTNHQIIKLMVSKSPSETYVKDVKRWVIPFLQRCEEDSPGARISLTEQFMLSLAKEDLYKCQLILENSKHTSPEPIIRKKSDLLSLAQRCIYACEKDDQLDVARKILKILPKQSLGVVGEDLSALYHDLEELEGHLQAVEILASHGVAMTTQAVKDTQSDEEAATKLMVRLARQAARGKPPKKEWEWNKLGKDMQELRRIVYSCLTSTQCQEIFTESLLGSGSIANIRLAGEKLTKTRPEGSTLARPSVKASSLIPYERSIDLVLSAAREYFNSSANLLDTTMELARSCLQLITDCPSRIQDELDLITSLALLDDFSTSILPLQVRLCEDRLELVEKVITSSKSSCTNSEKLLRLAKLLRVCGDNEKERQGKVLVLVSRAALQGNDYKTAWNVNKRLVSDGYGPAWEVCRDLALKDDFNDLPARRELLAFASAYCDPEALVAILEARNILLAQILYNKLPVEMEDGKKGKDNEEEVAMETRDNLTEETTDMEDEGIENDIEKDTPSTSTQSVTRRTRQILASTGAATSAVLATTGAATSAVLATTGATTKAVLASVSDAQWWAGTMQFLRPLGRGMAGDSQGDTDQDDVERCGIERRVCPAFYETCFKEPTISKDDPNYVNYQWTTSETSHRSLNEALLRAMQLRSLTKDDQSMSEHATHVLLQLAMDAFKSDVNLALAYLLALPNPLDADQCFEKIPHSALSLQLAAYYFALQATTRLQPIKQARKSPPIYETIPPQLIQKVLKLAGTKKAAGWADDVSALVGRLKHYDELLADLLQAQSLQALGRGVDVVRFTRDNEYKQETILGLAMSLEDDVYNLSVSLAQRYHLSMWEVLMAHLEFLFSESGLSTTAIEARSHQLDLIATLLERPEDFCERMETCIYPTIEGSDHQRLIYYFTLLQKSGAEVKGLVITPDMHVKLLKKIKAAASSLDYRRLMDGVSDPINVISPSLISSNVHVLAKLAPKIPTKNGGSLTPSQVFLAFIVKMFWDGDQNHKKAPETTAEWQHRYEACGEFFGRLTITDFQDFIKRIVFTQKSLDKLSLECRQNLVSRAIKFAKQQGSGKQKFAGETSENIVESTIQTLQLYQKHLQTLNTEGMFQIRQFDQDNSTKFYEKYDMSRGQTEVMKTVFASLICVGAPVSLLDQALTGSTITRWNMLSVIRDAIRRILTAIKSGDGLEDIDVDGRPIDFLKKVTQEVQKHTQGGGTLVTANHVLDELRPFCSDMSVAVEPRVEILQLLEETFPLSAEDSQLLLFYRTQAIVSGAWIDVQVTEEDVVSESSRLEVFKALLSCSASIDQLVALTSLLQQWPVLETNFSSPSEEPWVQAISKMTSYSEFKGQLVVDLMREQQRMNPLSSQCISAIYSNLVETGHHLASIKIVLITQQSDLYKRILDYMKVPEQFSEDSFDEELLQLFITRSFARQVVETPYYPPLADFLLSSCERSEVTEIARQLKDAGREPEAASLLLRQRTTHPMLGTLDTALAAVRYWFKK